MIRHTRLSCDWSSDVCSSDLEHTSELQSHDNLVCRLLLTRLSCDWSSDVCSRSEEHTSELQSHDNLVCRVFSWEEQTIRAPSHAILISRLLLEKSITLLSG